jgi:hypothetical protein
MSLLKKAWTVFATLVVVALLVAVVAPKAAHAVAAALVQIVPGTTTHVGQNESQLVSLFCVSGPGTCLPIDSNAAISSTPYVVPSGYTLIVTDWEWSCSCGGAHVGETVANSLVYEGNSFVSSVAFVTIANTGTYTHEHYATGIRVGSGVKIEDFLASVGAGSSSIQGYLVPN